MIKKIKIQKVYVYTVAKACSILTNTLKDRYQGNKQNLRECSISKTI